MPIFKFIRWEFNRIINNVFSYLTLLIDSNYFKSLWARLKRLKSPSIIKIFAMKFKNKRLQTPCRIIVTAGKSVSHKNAWREQTEDVCLLLLELHVFRVSREWSRCKKLSSFNLQRITCQLTFWFQLNQNVAFDLTSDGNEWPSSLLSAAQETAKPGSALCLVCRVTHGNRNSILKWGWLKKLRRCWFLF